MGDLSCEIKGLMVENRLGFGLVMRLRKMMMMMGGFGRWGREEVYEVCTQQEDRKPQQKQLSSIHWNASLTNTADTERETGRRDRGQRNFQAK